MCRPVPSDVAFVAVNDRAFAYVNVSDHAFRTVLLKTLPRAVTVRDFTAPDVPRPSFAHLHERYEFFGTRC